MFKYSAILYTAAHETKRRVKSVYWFEVAENSVAHVVQHLTETFKDDPYTKIGAFLPGWHKELP